MQSTLLGKTAGGLLKNATVCETQSGLHCIFLTLPNGRQVTAIRGDRRNGWGETMTDVLVLIDANGVVARLETSTAAYKKLCALEAKCEASYAQ